jgi:hypothetical protein
MHYPFFIAESPLSGGSNLAAILVRSMRGSSKKTRTDAIFRARVIAGETALTWIKIRSSHRVAHLSRAKAASATKGGAFSSRANG